MTAARTAQALATSPPLPSEENPGRMENRMPTLPKKNTITIYPVLSHRKTSLNLSSQINGCIKDHQSVCRNHGSIFSYIKPNGLWRGSPSFLDTMHLHEAPPPLSTTHYSRLLHELSTHNLIALFARQYCGCQSKAVPCALISGKVSLGKASLADIGEVGDVELFCANSFPAFSSRVACCRGDGGLLRSACK